MTVKVPVTALAGVALAALGIWWSDLYVPTVLNGLRHMALPLIVMFSCVSLGVVAAAQSRYNEALWAGTGALVGLAGFFGTAIYGSYLADKAYLAEVEISDAKLPSFDERTAWEVARNRVASDKGDLVGAVGTPTYLPEEQVFTTLVNGNPFTAGYAGVVEQTLGADGSTSARTCQFGDGTGKNGYRLGGKFDGSLAREIAHQQRHLVIDDEDAYGYCDGDTAVAVVPLKKQTGFYPVTLVPAGVAVYTAEDGVKLVDDPAEAGIPGPVYPDSLAARQREALKAHDSTLWTWLRGRAGFEEATTDGDPNSENPTEFKLNTADGSVYVTPMTTRPKQDQAKISSYGMVEADQVTLGKRNQLVLHTVPSEDRREANGVVVDNLKSFYSDADFGWAQGLKVFEMVPVSANEWVASLGFEKSVKFRVRLAADGSSCLEDAHGHVVRCVDETGMVVNDASEDADEDTGKVPTGELSQLSDADLAALQKAVTNELVRRLNATTASAQ